MSAITGFGTTQSLAPLHAKWGWIVALGVVYLVAGIIALGSIVSATVASVIVVGVMMIIAGVAEVINAFQVKTWGRFTFWLILGILYIIAGFVAWDNPLLTAVWLTLVPRRGAGRVGHRAHLPRLQHEGGSPWIWVVVSGLITLVLGVIILAHWPVSAVYTLGIFLGVDLVFAGASWIGLGMGLRNASSRASKGGPSAHGGRIRGGPPPVGARSGRLHRALDLSRHRRSDRRGDAHLRLAEPADRRRVLPRLDNQPAARPLVFVVYLLGAATGGSLYALLRRSVRGSRRAA